MFFLEPTHFAEISFRRFTREQIASCSELGTGHDATCLVYMDIYDVHRVIEVDYSDSRWPRFCPQCGYKFTSYDQRQIVQNQIFKRTDSDFFTTLMKAPIGAMWDASWMKDSEGVRINIDGMILVVKTTIGDWFIDGPSVSGEYWDRFGHPPNITVVQSTFIDCTTISLIDGFLNEVSLDH